MKQTDLQKWKRFLGKFKLRLAETSTGLWEVRGDTPRFTSIYGATATLDFDHDGKLKDLTICP